MKNGLINKIKKFFSIIAIAIIVLLYITTLILAIMNNSYTDKYFKAFLFASFFVPIMLYLFIWISKVLSSYNNPEDSSVNNHNTDSDK